MATGFHSISFPSEWGVEWRSPLIVNNGSSFHSISFPSEWGARRKTSYNLDIAVSIQLVSPASGEFWGATFFWRITMSRFHSISFPSEWGATLFCT